MLTAHRETNYFSFNQEPMTGFCETEELGFRLLCDIVLFLHSKLSLLLCEPGLLSKLLSQALNF